MNGNTDWRERPGMVMISNAAEGEIIGYVNYWQLPTLVASDLVYFCSIGCREWHVYPYSVTAADLYYKLAPVGEDSVCRECGRLYLSYPGIPALVNCACPSDDCPSNEVMTSD